VSTGPCFPTAKWPRLDRFIEHDIELPVGTVTVNAANESELRDALNVALEHGRGVAAYRELPVVAPKRMVALHRRPSFRRSGACPTCGTGFPELDPPAVSFNSRHGWCKSCFGTGLQMAEFDAEQSGEESKWRDADESRGAGRADVVCPDCAGERLNPVARTCCFADCRSRP